MPKVTKKAVKLEVVVATEDSQAKKDFAEFIARLKETKPEAYAKNEAELITKLNQL